MAVHGKQLKICLFMWSLVQSGNKFILYVVRMHSSFLCKEIYVCIVASLAIAQTVSCRLPTAVAWVRSQCSSYGICGV
jgi:hypothetical protein